MLYNFAIIGAGFGGLTAALRLQKSGETNFILFERANAIGGTWRDNIYPGCACDVQSHLYCFADEPNPYWTQNYSEQEEIWQYMQSVVDKRHLENYIQYQTEIKKLRFDATEGVWHLTDQNGNNHSARMVISAWGPLNRPVLPAFAGIEDFKGMYFHSARWQKNIDLKDKKVAIIGTGASAIQIIPSIAPQVEQLWVFQRTGAWVTHRFNASISPLMQKLYAQIPLLQRIRREMIYWYNELIGLSFVGHWWFNRLVQQMSVKKLQKEVRDPVVRQKLQPNYVIGCKRILKSDDYYPTFNRPNVSLITDSIASFVPQGIQTTDGNIYDCDVVVFATGFEAADVVMTMQIYGKSGKDLIQLWAEESVSAYRGTTVADYPNLFFLLGPNTGLGHNSVVHIMDSQMNYVMDYWQKLQQSKAKYFELKPFVQKQYNDSIQKAFGNTVWASGCQSWYQNKKGKITALYPYLTRRFRKETAQMEWQDYNIVL